MGDRGHPPNSGLGFFFVSRAPGRAEPRWRLLLPVNFGSFRFGIGSHCVTLVHRRGVPWVALLVLFLLGFRVRRTLGRREEGAKSLTGMHVHSHSCILALLLQPPDAAVVTVSGVHSFEVRVAVPPGMCPSSFCAFLCLGHGI